MEKFIGALRSKTMWFSLALTVLGVVQANIGIFNKLMTPDMYGWFTATVGLVVAVLRWVTTVALSDK